MTEQPTTVFRNGPVFRADAARSWSTAVAVREGSIVAVGEEEVSPYLRDADEVVDLDGRLLLPGFVDAHVHPVMGGLERMRCDLSAGRTLESYQATVREYVDQHPDRPWVVGGGWSMGSFEGGCPTADLLDAVVGDRPAYLPNRDHHSAWVSTRALELAGIDASTPDPADGRIERDASGRPTGTLHEGAAGLVEHLLPPDTQADFDEALQVGQAHLHSLGIVGWQDAWVEVHGDGPSVHEAYLRAQRAGTLTARVAGSLWWPRETTEDAVVERVAQLARVRDEAAGAGDRYETGTVKVMLDGVAETFTAAMLEPYLDRCGHPTGNAGLSFVPGELLHHVVVALDAAGFQVHFHALGDRAVREALDAVAAARAANGPSSRRHHLAHLQVVHPDDVPRFRQLAATANLQALWATHEPEMDELTIPFLGARRAAWQYPFGDLFRAGATLAMGSDWPVSSPDPLAAVHVAVNRVSPVAPEGTPPFLPGQALPLPVALAAYTAGSAYVSRLEGVCGSITVGGRADLVVLDRNPFDAPPEQIAESRVLRTYVDGRVVHRA
ncbi:MAG TPA: amidohydrolase [Marmoricola sp.]|nr:amidohydrolase [Marmoricola sp.]